MSIMIGTDPHKATHTAVAIDEREVVLDEFKIRASKSQVRLLCDWADRFEKREWAVESANGLGSSGCDGSLSRPVRQCSMYRRCWHRVFGCWYRRRSQKNDAIDARAVAVAAFRSDAGGPDRCR